MTNETLYEHRLARLLSRRSLEAAGRATSLDGMTWAEYAAARWPDVEPFVLAEDARVMSSKTARAREGTSAG